MRSRCLVSAAELFYLHHVRSCAATAAGALSTSGGVRQGGFVHPLMTTWFSLFCLVLTVTAVVFVLHFADVPRMMVVLSCLSGVLQLYLLLVGYHAPRSWLCRLLSAALSSLLWFPFVWLHHGCSWNACAEALWILLHAVLFAPFGKRGMKPDALQRALVEYAEEITRSLRVEFDNDASCEYMGQAKYRRSVHERDPQQWVLAHGERMLHATVEFRWVIGDLSAIVPARVNNVLTRGVAREPAVLWTARLAQKASAEVARVAAAVGPGAVVACVYLGKRGRSSYHPDLSKWMGNRGAQVMSVEVFFRWDVDNFTDYVSCTVHTVLKRGVPWPCVIDVAKLARAALSASRALAADHSADVSCTFLGQAAGKSHEQHPARWSCSETGGFNDVQLDFRWEYRGELRTYSTVSTVLFRQALSQGVPAWHMRQVIRLATAGVSAARELELELGVALSCTYLGKPAGRAHVVDPSQWSRSGRDGTRVHFRWAVQDFQYVVRVEADTLANSHLATPAVKDVLRLAIAGHEAAASLTAQRGCTASCVFLGQARGRSHELDPSQWGARAGQAWGHERVEYQWNVVGTAPSTVALSVDAALGGHIPFPSVESSTAMSSALSGGPTGFRCARSSCTVPISYAAHANFDGLCWRCHLLQSSTADPPCKNVSAFYVACPHPRERDPGVRYCKVCGASKTGSEGTARHCRNRARAVDPCMRSHSNGQAGFCSRCLGDMVTACGRSLEELLPELRGLCTNYTNVRVRCLGFVSSRNGSFCQSCLGSIVVRRDGSEVHLCKNAADSDRPCPNLAAGAKRKDGDMCASCYQVAATEAAATGRFRRQLCRRPGCRDFPVAAFAYYCRNCFTRDGLLDLRPDEIPEVLAAEVKLRRDAVQRVAGDEVPLRCYLPRRHFALPAYAGTAEFLPWHHCRICFAVLDGTSEAAFQASLAAHAFQCHGMTVEDMRQRVLETVMADFPTPITVQTHRSVLHRYRAHLCEENFTFQGCAVCARAHVRGTMCRALFPSLGSEDLPAWLASRGWSPEVWAERGEVWLLSVDQCFRTSRYVDVHFCSGARLAYAAEKLEASPGDPVVAGFARRVGEYVCNMQMDLDADAVPCPSGLPLGHAGLPVPWLFLPASCSWHGAELDAASTCSDLFVERTPAGCLQALVCGACARVLSQVPQRNFSVECQHDRYLPVESRANGFWGGPMPKELSDLGLAASRIIRLAHMSCLLLRVPLPSGHYHALKAKGLEHPQYHVGNVIAYPSYSADLPCLLGVLPEQLSNVLLVQYTGTRSSLQNHPSLTVSVPGLRAAFDWLLTHNWEWISATEHHDIDVARGRYGPAIDELLHAYQRDVGSEEGVPASVVHAATPIGEGACMHAAEGPAEAAQDTAEPVSAGGAIIDTASDKALALEQLNVVLRQHERVSACDAQRMVEGTADAVDENYLRLELVRLEKVRRAVEHLASSELRSQLLAFREEASGPLRVCATVSLGQKPVSSWSPNFWGRCFVEAFPRGDCQENVGRTRKGSVTGVAWSDLLLNQVDKPWFRGHKEWQAASYKCFVRRDQIRAVQLIVETDEAFGRDMTALLKLQSRDLMDLAIKTPGAAALQKLVYDGAVPAHVRQCMYHVVRVTRSVQGTDSERQKFHAWFEALRINKGCAVLFFTLNPRDTDSALTVRYMAAGLWRHKVIPLDADELDVHASFRDVRQGSPSALYDMISTDAVAANTCFHETVRLTLRVLFNMCPSSNDLETGSWSPLNLDGRPCMMTPGMVGHVSWYLGVTEPQLRKSLHLHALMGMVGFINPEALFDRTDVAATFVRVWRYVSSLYFRGPEAFAHMTGSSEAMAALSEEPLLPMKSAQKSMVDSDYVAECEDAQRRARGLEPVRSTSVSVPVQAPCAASSSSPSHGDGCLLGAVSTLSCVRPRIDSPLVYESLAPMWLRDAEMCSSAWSARAAKHFNTAYRACGNHTCLPHVCFKGKYGKKGLCRMMYWHWRERPSRQDRSRLVLKRLKGLRLQPRWSVGGKGSAAFSLPPVHEHPPLRGMPAVETNHGFACRFNPCGSLGPSCNHDVNVFLRLPVLSDSVKAVLEKDFERGGAGCDVDVSAHQEFRSACAEMHSSALEHEFYTSAYASKEQPKLEALMLSMQKSLSYLEEEIAEKRALDTAGQELADKEAARSILHRLVSATNNAAHKGFPEIVSHLTKRPNFYCSHSFAHVHLYDSQNSAVARVDAMVADLARRERPGEPQRARITVPCHLGGGAKSGKRSMLKVFDYQWRPDLLAGTCWYFFCACAELVSQGPALPWHTCQDDNGIWHTHPFAKVAVSTNVRDAVLLDPESGSPYVISENRCRVVTDKPWRVPIVYGHKPCTPHAQSTSRDKGLYALWMLLLFKPWRDLDVDLLAVCDPFCAKNGFISDPWQALYDSFEAWARGLASTARDTRQAYARTDTDAAAAVPWNSVEYWAVITAPVLDNMRLSLTRKQDTKTLTPSFFLRPAGAEMDSASDVSDAKSVSDTSTVSLPPGDIGDADDCVLHLGVPRREGLPCGLCPTDSEQLQALLLCKDRQAGRGMEAVYCSATSFLWSSIVAPALCTRSPPPHGGIFSCGAPHFFHCDTDQLFRDQQAYFKRLDSHEVDEPAGVVADCDDGTAPSSVTSDFAGHVQFMRDGLAVHVVAHESVGTVVLDAALFLLRRGLFPAPRSLLSDDTTPKWNTQQCLGFLLHAYLLQIRYARRNSGPVPLPSCKGDRASDSCIFTGAAGTGKTALQQACDVLTQEFFGESSVVKSAPTRTAARLTRGNTCHAAWKLPLRSSLGPRGRLTEEPLRRLRERLEHAEESSLDELSMCAPERYWQINCRAQQALGSDAIMGGLKDRLSGDFLQLPPVDSSSFAQCSMPVIDAPEPVQPSSATAAEHLADASPNAEDKQAERRLGQRLYEMIPNVIVLTNIVRAPNALGVLCTAIRHCRITDTVWALLESRVLRAQDARLRSPPFSNSPLRVVVQRHVLRAALSHDALWQVAPSLHVPVYICTAYDVVWTPDETVADAVRRSLLETCAYRHTGNLESFVVLYEGASMLLHGKDCTLLGLMNGVEVTVLAIALSAVDQHLVADGDNTAPRVLKNMPDAVLLRATGATWVLPPELLPDLPPEFDRRGLFLLKPTTSLRFTTSYQNTSYKVQRTQLPLLPSETRIVYGAQGESWDAAIVDLGKPPRMDDFIFWLAVYVMLTRAKSLEGLLIMRLPKRDALAMGPPLYLKQEMQRLQGLHNQTVERLKVDLAACWGELPADVAALWSAPDFTQQEPDWPVLDRILEEALKRERATDPSSDDVCGSPATPPPKRRLLRKTSVAAMAAQERSKSDENPARAGAADSPRVPPLATSSSSGSAPGTRASCTSQHSVAPLCPFCLRAGRACPAGSVSCTEWQSETGCHACGKCGCYTTNASCSFYGRGRVPHVDASEHGVVAPDILERSVVQVTVDPRTRTTWLAFRYAGAAHRLFVGHASGQGNNCLIDTLRQLLNDHGFRVVADAAWVRLKLQAQFADQTPSQVTTWNYLDLKEHWAAVIDLLGESARRNALDEHGLICHRRFSVVGISAAEKRIVAQEGTGRTVLFVLHQAHGHFVPLLKDRAVPQEDIVVP